VAKDVRYWDACAFSGYLNEEADKIIECESVLKAASNGHILIVTSALTLAEVLFAKNGPKLDPSKRNTVEKFFKADFISVRNVTRHIGDLARDIFWDYGIKPKDCVHVATAASSHVATLNTFDEDLIGKSGITIVGQTLQICRPHHVEQIPLKLDLPKS
jgi:predicted nucleic acid-binding protein